MNSISLRALSSDPAPDRSGLLARERHEPSGHGSSGREHGHGHGPDHEHGAGGAPAIHPSAIWWGLPARLGTAAALAAALWGVIGLALAGR